MTGIKIGMSIVGQFLVLLHFCWRLEEDPELITLTNNFKTNTDLQSIKWPKYTCNYYCNYYCHYQITLKTECVTGMVGRSQWPSGLRRMSTADRLLGLPVRILPGSWMFVCCKCCLLSGRCLCDGLITRWEESYWLWYVVCNLENSQNEAAG